MDVFEWSSRYATGYASVDEQYKRMVDAINALFEAIESGQGASVLIWTFMELSECLALAFTEESRFMRQTSYEALEEHERQHDKFRADMHRCEENSRTMDPNLCAIALAATLREWISDHVLIEDKKLFQHVHESMRPTASTMGANPTLQ